MYKVLFHLNEEGKAEGVFNNIKNLMVDVGEENLEVELIVHSKGVYSFKKDKNAYNKEVMNLLKKGIKIAICTNTIDNLHLKLEDLMPGVELVPSAVGEIVRKEKEGWIYIKP